MRRAILVLTLTGLLASLARPSAGAEEAEVPKIRLALTGTFMAGMDFEGEFGGPIGPGGRVDIRLGKRFSISPDAVAVLYWDTVATACTLNFRFGVAYAGLGPMVTLTDHRWKGDVFLKARLGGEVGHWFIEAVYVTGRSSFYSEGARVGLLGLSCGVVF